MLLVPLGRDGHDDSKRRGGQHLDNHGDGVLLKNWSGCDGRVDERVKKKKRVKAAVRPFQHLALAGGALAELYVIAAPRAASHRRIYPLPCDSDQRVDAFKMSSALIWELTKKNNAFLKKSVNGTVWSKEAGNL